MRIAIHTLGTRGDVQPYVALALGLMSRGHDVQLAGPVQYQDLAKARGVRFVALPAEFLALMNTPSGKAALAGGGAGFGAGIKLLKQVRPMMRRLFDLEWEAARSFSPNVVVHHPKSVASPHIAATLGIPAVLASPLPGFTPTRAFPSPMVPLASLGPLNGASHALAARAADLLFGRILGAWRAETLGLPARASGQLRPAATLYAYSPAVLPRPDDWGPTVHVTGYWFLDDPDWTMPATLSAFLDDGPKPVLVGFGSMPGLEPDALSKLVVEAVSCLGKRAILATGGGALSTSATAGNIHVIGGAPHDRLLPFVSDTLHHGGAGTTGASLRAGIPTAICPFFGDQPFWGRQVVRLGVGPAPLDRRGLTVERLTTALAAMDAPAMRDRAAHLGAAIRQDDGVAAACTVIEQTVAGR